MKKRFLQLSSHQPGLPAGVISLGFNAKALDVTDDGSITVNASVMGVMDRGGDCIFPGAFDGTLDGFLANGFNPVGHNWGDLAVAYPVSIKQDGNLLVSTAKFHSTPRGQEARTVAKERKDAGLSVPVSVGFMPDYANGVFQFRNGAALLAFAKAKDYDMSQFDSAQINAWTGPCRAITKADELFEWSICSVGMNRGAGATEAKSMQASGAMLRGYYDPDTGNYLTDTAADATLGALRTFDYALYRTLMATLYDPDSTVEDKVAAMDGAYNTYADQCVKVIEALLTVLADTPEDDQTEALMAFQSCRMPGVITLAAGTGKDSEVGPTGEPTPVEPISPDVIECDADLVLLRLRAESELALLDIK